MFKPCTQRHGRDGGVRDRGGRRRSQRDDSRKRLRKPLTGHRDVDIAVAAPFFD